MDAVRGSLLRASLVAGGVSFVVVLVSGALIGERTDAGQPIPATTQSSTQSTTQSTSEVDSTVETTSTEVSGTPDTTQPRSAEASPVETSAVETSTVETSTTQESIGEKSTGPAANQVPPGSAGAEDTLTVRIRAENTEGDRIPIDNADEFDVVLLPAAAGDQQADIQRRLTSREVEITVRAPASTAKVCVTSKSPNWRLPADGVNRNWTEMADGGICHAVTEPSKGTILVLAVHS